MCESDKSQPPPLTTLIGIQIIQSSNFSCVCENLILNTHIYSYEGRWEKV